MNLQEKNIGVAFIHRFLGLGGVEQVSLQTGLIFQKLGVLLPTTIKGILWQLLFLKI